MQETEIKGIWKDEITETETMVIDTLLDQIRVFMKDRENPIKFDFPEGIYEDDIQNIRDRILNDLVKIEPQGETIRRLQIDDETAILYDPANCTFQISQNGHYIKTPFTQRVVLWMNRVNLDYLKEQNKNLRQ